MIQKLHEQPDIFQIQVPLPDNPLKYLNSYVLPGKERTLVVDTGFKRPECRNALMTGLKELAVDLSKVDLFLTHLHADHSGLVNDFVAAGATVYMHQIDYQYLQDGADGSMWAATEKRYAQEGMPGDVIRTQAANQARKFAPDPHFPAILVQDRQILHLADQYIHVIHTPGHTKGLCCLYIPEHEIFFSSDHILFDITPNITIWNNMQHALHTYLESLDKVRNFPVKLALPGHRKGDTSVVERIDSIKAHHRHRLTETCQLVRTMPEATAFEIAAHMTWSMRGKCWEDFPITQKWFALGECLSHLEYLLDEGTIQRREMDGLYRYSLR